MGLQRLYSERPRVSTPTPADELAKHLHRQSVGPQERYGAPVTSSMEYGWIVPAQSTQDERRFARKSSDITKNPANYARMEKKADKIDRNTKA